MRKCSICKNKFNIKDMAHVTFCYSRDQEHNLCEACCIDKAVNDYINEGKINNFLCAWSYEVKRYYQDWPTEETEALRSLVERKRSELIDLIKFFNRIRLITRLIETRLVWGLSLKEAFYYSKFYTRFIKLTDVGMLYADHQIADIFNWFNRNKPAKYIGKLFAGDRVINDEVSKINFSPEVWISSGNLCRSYITIYHKDFELEYIMDDSSTLPSGGIQSINGKADIIESFLTDFLVRGINE